MWRILPAVLGLLPLSSVLAQTQPTTVQLPTFSVFTVSTTVSVPDRGSMFLGGVNRAASGRVERGVPFRNVGIGSARSTGGMHVSATIIDHAEMDEALLAKAAARRGGLAPEADKPPSAVAGAVATGPGRNSAASAALSVAEIRRQQATEEASQSAEGLAYLGKADQAAKEGKPGLARIYYRMAAARLTGEAARRARSLGGN